MHYARMGNTGLDVSRVCVGTDVDLPPAELLPILRRANELGVNFVDTDNAYSYNHPQAGSGPTWEAVHQWLREVDRAPGELAAPHGNPEMTLWLASDTRVKGIWPCAAQRVRKERMPVLER